MPFKMSINLNFSLLYFQLVNATVLPDTLSSLWNSEHLINLTLLCITRPCPAKCPSKYSSVCKCPHHLKQSKTEILLAHIMCISNFRQIPVHYFRPDSNSKPL